MKHPSSFMPNIKKWIKDEVLFERIFEFSMDRVWYTNYKRCVRRKKINRKSSRIRETKSAWRRNVNIFYHSYPFHLHLASSSYFIVLFFKTFSFMLHMRKIQIERGRLQFYASSTIYLIRSLSFIACVFIHNKRRRMGMKKFHI